MVSGMENSYGVVPLLLLAIGSAVISIIFSFISLIFIFRGSTGKFFTFFAIVVDVTFFIIVALNFS